MGSSCSTNKDSKVVRPIVITEKNKCRLSAEINEKSPETEAPPPNTGKRKKSSMDWDVKSPRSEANGERSSCFQLRNTEKGTDPNQQKEDMGFGETNASRIRTTTGDTSPMKKVFFYKKGPVIDSNNSYAEVCEVLNMNQGDRLAVKSYHVYGEMSKIQEYLDDMQEEMALLQELEHINLIKYYGIDAKEIKEPNYMEINIIMEYASGGSVWGLVSKFSSLDERLIKAYTRQILEGLLFLHSEEYIHGNLKSSNVLIDSIGIIKLSDTESINKIKQLLFENPQGDNQKDIISGSIYWTAPEVLMDGKLEKAADVWSVGCVVFEMLTRIPLWGLKTADEAYKLITSQELPPFPPNISESCVDFLQKTLRFKPEERATVAELLEHPFLNDNKLSEHEQSSMFESLRSMHSFSGQNRNNLLQSLNSLNNNSNSNCSSLETSQKKQPIFKSQTLARVSETNREEEYSPMDPRDEFGRRILCKGRWFENGELNKKYSLKKSKTQDLKTVRELDQEEGDEKGTARISNTSSRTDRLGHHHALFPLKPSIFKSQNTLSEDFVVEGSHNEKNDEDEELRRKMQGMTKEEQRRLFEEQLLRELERAPSKDMSQSSQSMSQSKNFNRFASIDSEFEGKNEGKDEVALKSGDLAKKIGTLRAQDVSNDSAPFVESKPSTVMKLESMMSGDFGEAMNKEKDEKKQRFEAEMQKKLDELKRKNSEAALNGQESERKLSNKFENFSHQVFTTNPNIPVAKVNVAKVGNKEYFEAKGVEENKPFKVYVGESPDISRADKSKSKEYLRISQLSSLNPDSQSSVIKLENVMNQESDQMHEKGNMKEVLQLFGGRSIEHQTQSQIQFTYPSNASIPNPQSQTYVLDSPNKVEAVSRKN